MNTFTDFLKWEQASRDTIDFKRMYVDMADDLVAGLMLSEIVFWHLPNQAGKTKLRVTHDDQLWIACHRTEWWDRIRISPKQADRALELLEKRKLIIRKLYPFNGAPTIHIRLDSDEFLKAVDNILDHPVINPFLPKVKKDIDKRVKSITETTTEITNTTAKPSKSEGLAGAATPALVSEPEQAEQPHVALINAYWSGLPGGQPINEDYPRHTKLAVKAVARGVTPDEITAFMADIHDPATTVFNYKKWHTTPIPFEEVIKMLPPWKVAHTPPPMAVTDYGDLPLPGDSFAHNHELARLEAERLGYK